jgi:hypothetical protein
MINSASKVNGEKGQQQDEQQQLLWIARKTGRQINGQVQDSVFDEEQEET